MSLTIEDGDAYAFLGVDVRFNETTQVYTLSQQGLIKKILKTVGMEDCNAKGTPTNTSPLVTDKDGQVFREKWQYSAVVGMLLYLSSNTCPDIQFAVHQCARFGPKNKQSST